VRVRNSLVLAGCVVAAAAAVGASTAAATGASDQVVVPRGQPVQIAVVLDKTGLASAFGAGARNAIRMAVQTDPTIHGFAIKLNDGYDGPCGGTPDFVDANAAAAASVVANPQNVAVVGHMCSFALAGCPDPPPTTALSLYQSAGIVAINGSATAQCLPPIGPTIFDRTAVADPDFDAWYARVQTLPVDRLWRLVYTLEFGSAPTDFADLYFDATRLLLARIEQVSHIVGGNLVIDRAALATAVRKTTAFPGVTCSISIDPATGNRVNDPAALARCGG